MISSRATLADASKDDTLIGILIHSCQWKNTLVKNMEITSKNNDSDGDIKLNIINVKEKNENNKKKNAGTKGKNDLGLI